MAKKNNTSEHLPSKADVMKFIMLYDFLESAYVEMKDFSKKNPDATLNERKVKSLNRILKDIKNIQFFKKIKHCLMICSNLINRIYG